MAGHPLRRSRILPGDVTWLEGVGHLDPLATFMYRAQSGERLEALLQALERGEFVFVTKWTWEGHRTNPQIS
jgi:hypothetical protein